MKASVKFHDEKCPLLRFKFPFSVSGFPLSSDVFLGDPQDLALCLGTAFDAGPSLKVAYRPNSLSSPLFLVLKTGIGAWGSPKTAALAMEAEFNLLGHGGPVFSMHMKPRLGDFSLRKKAKSVSHPQVEIQTEAINGEGEGYEFESIARTPLKLGKSSLVTPMPKRHSFPNGHAFLHMSNDISETPAVEKVENWENDAEKVVSPNTSLKIEGLDRNCRSQEEVLPQVGRTHSKSVSMPWRVGFDGSLTGWSVNAHSTLPLGKQAELNVQWGMQVHSDFMRGLESNNLSCFKLPCLNLQKISIASVKPPAETSNTLDSTGGGQLQQLATTEEIRELSHVAALCGSMKRHLHFVYAENEVLKKAMEELRSGFEHRGGAKLWRAEEKVPKLVDDPQRVHGAGNNKDAKERKDWNHVSGKDQDANNGSLFDRSGQSPGGLDGLDAPRKAGDSESFGSNGKNLSTTNKSLLG